MARPYTMIDVEKKGDVSCVRFRESRLNEDELYALCGELVRLVDEDGCRKMVLSLGPPEPEFLYSIFLAKLVSLQRRLREKGGALRLADVGPNTLRIFDACRLVPLFDFAPDREAALAGF
jgi:anti-anti-sigma factor